MLAQLHIQNFALMDSLTIEFDPRLNVLTGETGAGKSILIDAIRFVLGERSDTLKIGVCGKTSTVEAVFDPEKRVRKLDALTPYFESDEEVLILRRELTGEGRSRAWVNGRMVNVSALKDLGSQLIDIHGQYDHQLLLDSGLHLGMLDRFTGEEALKPKWEYQKLFAEYDELSRRRDNLSSLESGREREIDLLKYQIDEIENARLKNEEEEAGLAREQSKMANAEKLNETVSALVSLLDEDEASVTALLGKASHYFSQLVKFDDSLAALKTEFDSAETALGEIARTLSGYRENLSFDPDRLREIEARLDVIHLLKRKYGGSIPEILEFCQEAKAKYDQLANASVYSREAEAEIKKIEPKLAELAGKISESRKKSAAKLKKNIEFELADLGIERAKFECRFEPVPFSSEGIDQVEFMISPNPGQPLLPLKKIISAGEVARVMLAMKKALVKADPIETLIFDEIDSNIGGRMGTVTGEKLKEIASGRQVLLITHLPQIASFADRHFKVSKAVKSGKTITEYRIIDGDARVKELAQMMSGKSETEISRKHAEEMLARVGK